MSIITYQMVLGLIRNINTFAEQSDQKIQQLWSNFNNSKARLEKQYNEFMSGASSELNANSSAIKKKATKLKESAESVYEEILTLDTALANADKYYIKTREKKAAELAQKTESSITSGNDFFVALEQVKGQFTALSAKYSKDKMPALFDGINYLFSSQRKQDYEELIVLKNTLEKLMDEIIKAIPELIGDSMQGFTENHSDRTTAIKKKYQTELTSLNEKYENNVMSLADEICEHLDAVLPDSLLRSLSDINKQYSQSLLEMNSSYSGWNQSVIIGHIDYPLELFVSSNILFSLIKDKCGSILVQKKLLRFPLVFSLRNAINLHIKHTAEADLKEKFIASVMQSFISSVPITDLEFTVIDSENNGKSISALFDYQKKLPLLFGKEILITSDGVEEALEKICANIDECIRYKLGSSYENVFEYADDNSGASPAIKVVVVFDSPKSLGEKNIDLINNIIDNGSRCGVYAIIAYNPSLLGQAGSMGQIYSEKDCMVVQQAVDMFLSYGLHVVYNDAPSGKDLAKYINKYLLLFDCFRGGAAMLDSAIKELLVNENIVIAKDVVSSAKKMLDMYFKSYGTVPPTGKSFPFSIPVGSLQYPMSLVSDSNTLALLKDELALPNAEAFNLSAILDLREENSLLITCPEAVHQEVIKFVHSLMWSFLSFIPVGKTNFCVFDAERRGNSITPFLDFRQKLPEIFDDQLYTTQDAMLNRLQKLNKFIDEFIQEKLGNRFDNIAEYNLNTPNRAEAITILVVFDFPKNFDSRSIELLLNILSNGRKCGICTIICHNPSIAFSKYESIDEHLNEIRKHCTLVDYIDKRNVLQPYELPIVTAPELTKDMISAFVDDYIKANTALKHRGLSFEDVVCQPFFTASTAKRLSIPVGIGDGESLVHLVLGEGSSHHGLIAGATGSGKSTLLHTMIMSSMLCHSPDELHLYLMDFKSGTEFKIYESVRIPHIQLIALDAMQEFGESILENLVGEMLRRGDLFKSAGQSSLAAYISSTGKPLPRILVIMDEFQILFNDSANRKVAMNCAELTKRIVTEGRAFGIHLMMATQTTKVISELTLSHGIIEQMRIRIGLKCGADDVRYLYGDRNDAKALEMMKGPIGTAVMNLEYMESNNIGFRAAYCSNETQEELLALISEKFADFPATTQIFEGNRTVSLADYLLRNSIGYSDEAVIKMHMGVLIKVAPPFIMQFDRRRRHNLLICGANEGMSENLINLCIFSALMNTKTEVYCIDGEILIGEGASAPMYDCFGSFAPRFKTANSRNDILTFINALHVSYLERKKSNELKQTLVVIKNIQFLDVIKKMFKGEFIDESQFDDDTPKESEMAFNFGSSGDYSSSSMSSADKLLQLIDDGANFGIFFIVSSLEYQSVKENMYYGENILAKFPERIIFALSNNDADNLIDGVAVSGLRDNTVFYSDGVKSAFQFKPYVMPNVSELRQFIDSLPVGGDAD